MKTSFLSLLFLCFLTSLSATEFRGAEAHKIVPGARKVRVDDKSGAIRYVKLETPQPFDAGQLGGWLKSTLQAGPDGHFVLYAVRQDQLGFTHYRFQQYCRQYPVEHAVYYIHAKGQKIVSANGDYRPGVKVSNAPSVTAAEALAAARGNLNARQYAPAGPASPQLVILHHKDKAVLAYKCDVHSLQPLAREWAYVDASSGAVVRRLNRLHTGVLQDSLGTAETKYSGTRHITTDHYNGQFRLRESGRGNGIITWDCNQSSYPGDAVDFTDADNYWDVATNQDDAAYGVHHSAEITFDYFFGNYGLNSYDNQGAVMNSYVHYGYNYANAFWDGTGFYFGDGDGYSYQALTTPDIVAHEITHAVTEYSAGLVYESEPGALNESFSDIFGVIVDFIINPETANFQLGEQASFANNPIRDMSNPNAGNDPDTYQGLYWWTSSADNYGVHTNSGVQNYWFYLLAEGGSGVNDNGDEFTVKGIGLEAAGAIAYRNLSEYLTPMSGYADARYYAIESAIDLYGECSDPAISTTNAWYAVGVGDFFSEAVVATADANVRFSCVVPATVHFISKSLNADSFQWDFGDGHSSTLENPAHEYLAEGVYTVSLIASGHGACGTTDTTLLTDFITVTNTGGPVSAACTPASTRTDNGQGIYQFSFAGLSSSSALGDNGYSDYTCSHEAHATEGLRYPLSVRTGAEEWVSLWIDLDGNGHFDPAAELAYASPSPGYLHAAEILLPRAQAYDVPLRIRVRSGQSPDGAADPCAGAGLGENEDYTLWISQNNDPPAANFSAEPTLVNTGGQVQFADLTENLPDTWYWEFEGGSPATSAERHPLVSYQNTGAYRVTLVAANAQGADTLVREGYIDVTDVVNMCEMASTTAPDGILFDSGGADGPYGNMENCSFLINPGCAQEITLSFRSFSLEYSYDYLYVYDGMDDTGAPLLWATGSALPDSVTALSGAMYIEFRSDYSVISSGWEAHWRSVVPPDAPEADFAVSDANPPLSTPVRFTDQTTNYPNSWLWDFGDGATSVLQDPEHAYAAPGSYTVRLITNNCYASDTAWQSLTVQDAPLAGADSSAISLALDCGAAAVVPLTVSNSGAGALQFSLDIGQELFDSTSVQPYAGSGAETSHAFSGVNQYPDSLRLEIMLNGDYDDTGEYAALYIDGAFIQNITDGNPANGTDILVAFTFDAAETADWRADGQITVDIRNSSQVDIGIGGTDTHQARLLDHDSGWLQAEPREGVLSPGDSLEIALSFDASSLNAGAYANSVFIQTNDPDNPVLAIPVTLDVIGYPEISFSSDCLDFGQVMQHTASARQLAIHNAGCAALEIDSLLSARPEFTLSFRRSSIPPGGTDTLSVTFSSDTVGIFEDTVRVVDNVQGEAYFCLRAVSSGAPAIAVSPASIEVSMNSCRDSIAVPVTISNTAYDGLEFHFANGGGGDTELGLDSVLARLNRSYASINSLVPSRYDFTEGVSGTYIYSGGNNMYYYGNYLHVNYGYEMPYSDNQVASYGALGQDGRYFTRKYPGLFVFAADIQGVDNFIIGGNLGAYSGNVDGTVLTREFGAATYTGFVKRVFGAGSPSVNHLVIVRAGDSPAEHYFSSYPGDDYHEVVGLGQASRLYYLLFASEAGGYIDDAQIEAIMDDFISIVESSGFITLPEGGYSLGAGESMDLELSFSTEQVAGGRYEEAVSVYSNDPLNPLVNIPVVIDVSYDLCAGFEYQQATACSREVQFTSTAINTPDTYLWDFGDGATSALANPTHSYAAPGTYEVRLQVSNDVSADEAVLPVVLDAANGPVSACEIPASSGSITHDISRFTLNTIDVFSGSSSNGYTDYTCDHSTTLAAGVPYDITIQGYYNYRESVRVWIDLDNSGSFEEEELVFEELDAYTPHTGAILIPADIVVGVPLRMRVACEDDYYPAPMPCGGMQNGEVEDYTVILEANDTAPAVNFDYFVIDECQGLVEFTDLSFNFPTGWHWDFGDGGISGFRDPYHFFPRAGEYEVTLTASNEFGSSSSSQVVVVNSLGAEIGVSPTPAVGEPLSFTAHAPGAEAFFWDFGDGHTAEGPEAAHTYAAGGLYLASLRVTNAAGCENRAYLTIDLRTTGAGEVVSQIRTYPNPTRGELWVDYGQGLTIGQLMVFDVAGRSVYRESGGATAAPHQLSLGGLPSGMYILRVQFSNGSTLTERIVVQTE